MVNCPACDQSVDEDFGMVSCPHCKAVFMISYSGDIEYNPEGYEEEPVDTESFEETEEATESFEPSIVDSQHRGFDSEFSEDEESFLEDDQDVEIPNPIESFEDNEFSREEDTEFGSEEVSYDIPETSFDSLEPEEDDGLEEPIEEPVIEGGVSMNHDAFSSYEDMESNDDASSDSTTLSEDVTEELDSEEEYVEEIIEDTVEEENSVEEAPAVADKTPVDVTSFANSEESLLEDGEYLYTVDISRIDSKELKDDLKYVLMDEKLKLNYHEYLKNIANGQVSIPDLHPLKAKRIVEQLQFFDLEVRWVQKRVIIEDLVQEDFDDGEEFE